MDRQKYSARTIGNVGNVETHTICSNSAISVLLTRNTERGTQKFIGNDDTVDDRGNDFCRDECGKIILEIRSKS